MQQSFFNRVAVISISPRSVCIYGLCVLAHYAAAHIYYQYCTPLSIKGFIMSPFLTATPQCQMTRWVITRCGHSISAIWIVIGSYVVQFLTAQPNFVSASASAAEKNKGCS